jgi:hypothetical protein
VDIVERLRQFGPRWAADLNDGKIIPFQVCGEAAIEIERLRAALEVCGASFISDPCTVAQGHSLLAAEFRRRMDIANQALTRG